MEPEVIAAIVGGGFTLIATLIATVYQIGASRTKQTSRQENPNVDEPGGVLPVDDAKPSPIPRPDPSHPPAPEPGLPMPEREMDDLFADSLLSPVPSPKLAIEEYEIKENDPDDPFFKTLPRARAKNTYPRLRGKELDSQFLTDYTLNCRDGDRLEFSDGGES